MQNSNDDTQQISLRAAIAIVRHAVQPASTRVARALEMVLAAAHPDQRSYTFTPAQRAQLIDLLWASLLPGHSNAAHRTTGWGDQSQSGLARAIESIINGRRL